MDQYYNIAQVLCVVARIMVPMHQTIVSPQEMDTIAC
jgi:hypothetical protein